MNDKLFKAIFGGWTPEDEAAHEAEAARQKTEDWAAAAAIASAANEQFPTLGTWLPALSFKWQPRAVCFAEECVVMADVFPDGEVYHYVPDMNTKEETEVKIKDTIRMLIETSATQPNEDK